MEQVDRRCPGRQGPQVGPFGGVKLARTGLELALVAGVDLVAPLACLGIGVVPVPELPPGQEVVLEVVEGSFHVRRAIGVALFMGAPCEAVAFGEGLHLRHRDHVPARSLEHHDVGVVDAAEGTGAIHVDQGVGHEQLALEPAETGVELEELQPRVAQHQAGRLRSVELATDGGHVGRGVMLHLLAGVERVVTGGNLGLVADAVAPAERGQRLVAERGSFLDELLVHPNQVALAAPVEIHDGVAVRLRLLGPLKRRHLRRARPHHVAHRPARQLHRPGNRPQPEALPAQLQDGRPLTVVQHRSPPCPSSVRAG